MNLGHLLPEDPPQAGDLVQLAHGPGVPHLEMSPSHQDIQEIFQIGSGSGLGGTILLAGEIECEPDSETWSIPVGYWVWEPLLSTHVRQNRGPDISGTSYRFQETSSLELVQMSIRASICHSFTKVAESEEEIVAAMRGYGLVAIADRLNHLRALIAEDPDEPGLVLESLRSFAGFFMHEDRLPVPEGRRRSGRVPGGRMANTRQTRSASDCALCEVDAPRRALLGPRRWYSGDEVSSFRIDSVRCGFRTGRSGQGEATIQRCLFQE